MKHLAVFVLSLLVATSTLASSELPAVEPGERVAVERHGQWKPATVRQVAGPLVLVQDDRFESEFHWAWVRREQVRAANEQHEAPDRSSQIRETVGIGTVAEALAEAQSQLRSLDVTESVPDDPEASDEEEPRQPALVDRTPTGRSSWSYEPAGSVAAKLRARSIRLSGDFDASTLVRLIDLDRPTLLLSRTAGRPGKPIPERVAAELIDGPSGRSRIIELLTDVRPLDISPDGRRLLARSDAFHVNTKNRLRLFDLVANRATAAADVAPFGKAAVDDAQFLDGGERILARRNGELVVLDTDSLASGWRLDVPGIQAVAVRSDGQAIAVAVGGFIRLFDPSGSEIGTLGDDVAGIRSLAFDERGQRLAASASNRLVVWNLAEDGAVLLDTGVAESGRVQFVGDGLLLHGEQLVNPNTGGIVWRYKAPPANVQHIAAGAGSALLTPAFADDPAWLHVINLPHRDASAAARKVETNNLLQRGQSVSLYFTGIPNNRIESVTAALRVQLEAAGLTVADGDADLRLVLSTRPGTTVEQTYRFGLTERTTTVRQQHHTVELQQADGTTLWQAASTFRPPTFIRVEQGEALEEAIARSRRESFAFFESLRLPSSLIVTTSPIGQSPLRP